MQAKHTTAAYDLYVEIHAAHTGKTAEQVQAEMDTEQFEWRVRALHQQYMSGQFSIGKLADLLGVPPVNLYDILNELELLTYR